VGDTVVGVRDEPLDPFADDPADPAAGLSDELSVEPLSPQERQEVTADLEELEIFQSLLEPTGMRGLVIDCEDCHEPHYFGWELLHGNLRHLLEHDRPRLHEPAFDPDPDHYVSWDYARGYADGVRDALTGSEAPSGSASGGTSDTEPGQ
jgi:hypothetical protein